MNGGSYYLFWFLAPMLLSLWARHPALLIIVLLALAGRRWLPDPYLFFKYGGRIRSLRIDIAANPDNVVARRELAAIYLEKRRPRAALTLIEEALARDAAAPELIYLHGRALLGARRYEQAVERLLAAVALEPKLAYGEPLLKAGDALARLGRLAEAEDAYARVVHINRSTVEARCKLGLVRAARKEPEGAKAAFADARDTFRQLPTFQRRKQWWWALRAWAAA